MQVVGWSFLLGLVGVAFRCLNFVLVRVSG